MSEEPGESLWWLAASPAVWAAHFLLVYGLAAVACEKLGRLGAAGPVAGASTVAALVAVALVGARGWRRHQWDDALTPHDFDSPTGRTRFLGFAVFLLSALAAVAIGYEALALLILGGCR